MIRSLSFIVACLIIGCNTKNNNATSSILISNIATYYNESVDSAHKYIIVEDSNKVANESLEFYYFYDRRDIDRGDVYMKNGIYIDNLQTGNHFILSIPTPGYEGEKGHLWGVRAGRIPFNEKEYYTTAGCDSLGSYYRKNIGISAKLSSVLNDFPLNVRKNLTRNDLDSIFHFALFLKYQVGVKLMKQNDVFKDSASKYFDLRFLVLNQEPKDQTFLENTLKLDKLIKYIYDNCDKNNYFAYDYNSQLVNDDVYMMVVLNEGLNQTKQNDFFKLYNEEPILYNVRVYSGLYFIPSARSTQ